MATSMNAYEGLYINLKNRFTVVDGNKEYSLGEYMLIKAGKKQDPYALPVAETTFKQPGAIVTFVNFINDKLMVREAPQKDKVMRAFPFRTAAAAVLSALLVCTFVVTYSATTLNSATQEDIPGYMSISDDEKLDEIDNKYKIH